MAITDTNIKSFELNKHLMYHMENCDDSFIKEADRDIYFDFISQSMVARLSAYVWSESVQKEYRSVSYPENCWEHLKQRFFLPDGWVRKRWPVKMRKECIRFEVKATYPDFRPNLDSHQVRFKGVTIENPYSRPYA